MFSLPRLLSAISLLALSVQVTHLSAAAMTAEDAEEGKRLFAERCLSCHGGALQEAPKVEALHLYPPERIVESLVSGVMSTAGLTLSRPEKHQVAWYLTGKTVEDTGETVALNYCAEDDAVSAAAGDAS